MPAFGKTLLTAGITLYVLFVAAVFVLVVATLWDMLT